MGALRVPRTFVCSRAEQKAVALATRPYAREGCRTGRHRAAAGRGCRYMHGRRTYTVSICVYVCLAVCGGGGEGGAGGGRVGGRGVEGGCKDARVVRARRSCTRRHSVPRWGYP